VATETALAESSQALFCALADYVGVVNLTNKNNPFHESNYTDSNKKPNYIEFKKSWNLRYPQKTINSVLADRRANVQEGSSNISAKELESFLLNKSDWFLSSMLIAKKLITDIQKISSSFTKIKSPNWSDIFYVRGDAEIMGGIGKLFDIANSRPIKGSIAFGDINKWNPADIYLASNFARADIAKKLNEAKKTPESFTFLHLNKFIGRLIEHGDLLPLSLKKQQKSVTIVKVNFNRNKELDELSENKYFGTRPWKPYTKQSPQTRDLQIYFNRQKQDHIKIRHDASTAGLKAEFMISNSEARGGSIGSAGIFASIIKILDSSFAAKFSSTYESSNNQFRNKVKTLGNSPSSKIKKDQYNDDRGEMSAIYVTNNIIPILMRWLNGDKRRANKFIQLLFQYITSRTQQSGKFVIAK